MRHPFLYALLTAILRVLVLLFLIMAVHTFRSCGSDAPIDTSRADGLETTGATVKLSTRMTRIAVLTRFSKITREEHDA